MNPLNLPGPTFLLVWILGWAVVIGAALVIRALVAKGRARGDARRSTDELVAELHATEIAFLVGGTRRAVEAAVVGLEHAGYLKVDVHDRVTLVDKPRRPKPDGARDEQNVFRGIAFDDELSDAERHVLTYAPASMQELVDAPLLEATMTEKLVAADLLVAGRTRKRFALWALPVAWWTLGAAKLAVGISRDRPVALLFVLFGVACYFVPRLLRVPRLTALGRSVVAKLVDTNRGLETTAKISPQLVDAVDMSLAYALFGPPILAAGLASIMPTFLTTRSTLGAGATCSSAVSSCGSTCSSGSSTSSCSSGGSSCGGGCGGGCGGCS